MSLTVSRNLPVFLASTHRVHHMTHATMCSDSISNENEYGSTFVSYDYLSGLLPKDQYSVEFLKNELGGKQEPLLVKKL